MDEDRYNWISRRAHEIWQQEDTPAVAIANRRRADTGAFTQPDPDGSTTVKTILIVEKEPMIRFATMMLWSKLGKSS